MFKGEWYIFGARSTAIGMIRALRSEYTECVIKGVIVSSMVGNPKTIEGVNVEELSSLNMRLTANQKENVQILIATPVYVQREITDTLKIFGFKNIYPLDSVTEADVMKRYFDHIGLFTSIKDIDSRITDDEMPKTCILEVWHETADPFFKKFENPAWVHSFHAGVTDAIKIDTDIYDMDGDNIASRNTDFCELTALYWAWKNLSVSEYEYVGTSQYRRNLDITAENLLSCKQEDVDVVLPYPMLHVPNIKEHHTRYTNDAEWQALIDVIAKLYPEYLTDMNRIFESQYMYNYNMLLAKKEVFDEYCEWLFDILFALEDVIKEREITPAMPYLPFFGENLLTLYFMHNLYRYKIRHTGRMLRA